MDKLIAKIKDLPDDCACELLRHEFATRIESTINQDWEIFRRLMRAARAFREKQSVPCYINTRNGYIPVSMFMEYIKSIEYDIKNSVAPAEFKAEFLDLLYLHIDDIKIEKQIPQKAQKQCC